MKILTNNQDTPVMAKTRELCQTILEQPAYLEMKRTITDFLANQEACEQYRRLCDLQESLHGKEEQGEPVTQQELEGFERLESEFLANPLAQRFIETQRHMHKIESSITAYVRKAFELGRVPTDADFQGGGCGPSCGCH